MHRRLVNEAGDASEDMEMGRHFDGHRYQQKICIETIKIIYRIKKKYLLNQ